MKGGGEAEDSRRWSCKFLGRVFLSPLSARQTPFLPYKVRLLTMCSPCKRPECVVSMLYGWNIIIKIEAKLETQKYDTMRISTVLVSNLPPNVTMESVRLVRIAWIFVRVIICKLIMIGPSIGLLLSARSVTFRVIFEE